MLVSHSHFAQSIPNLKLCKRWCDHMKYWPLNDWHSVEETSPRHLQYAWNHAMDRVLHVSLCFFMYNFIVNRSIGNTLQHKQHDLIVWLDFFQFVWLNTRGCISMTFALALRVIFIQHKHFWEEGQKTNLYL